MHDARPTLEDALSDSNAIDPPLIEAGYLTQGREQVYYTCYSPRQAALGSVLHAGPFAFERSATWVHCQRWVQLLVSAGFRVMRVDYRGMGESSGRFEEQGPREWSQDLRLGEAWLRDRHPTDPLLLHGLRLGSLLAYDAFQQGAGDGLLMWSPPTSAQDMLYALLRLRIAADFALPPEQRRSRDDYLADMNRGECVEVDCYRWSKQLWEGAVGFEHPDGDQGELPGPDGVARPWQQMDLQRMPNNPGLAFDPMTWKRVQFRNPDFTELFRLSTEWLVNATKDIRCARSSSTN